MSLLSRRRVWVFNLVLVTAGIGFGVRTLSHGSEAKPVVPDDALASLAEPPRKQVEPPPVAPKQPEPAPIAEPAPVAAPAPAPVPAPVVEPPPAPPQPSSLTLTLLGTSVITPGRYSSALIADSTQRSTTYWPGDVLPGAGPVVAIAPRYVDFINRRSGRTERIEIGERKEQPAAEAETRPQVTTTPGTPKDELTAQAERSIKQVDATHWNVDRSFVDGLLGNPAALMTQLRARPVPSKNGQPGGLKLGGVRPGSPAEKIGLKNGDLITAINGFDMGSGDYDKMLEMYTKLKSARSLSVQVSRGGQPVQLEYSIQ
jgi:general secretion pathway protein C